MALAAQQHLLARLYTEAGFRHRFFSEPESVAAEFGLSIALVREMAGLPVGQVQSFARSLQRKRMNDVAKMLPTTCRRLGTRFDKFFLRFADSSPALGKRAAIDDAVSFAKFLQNEADTEDSFTDLADAEVARYEAARLLATRARIVLRCFRFDVRGLLRGSARLKPGPVERRKFTLGIWFRPWPRARLRHAFISLAIRRTNQG